jgi:hypothetical protein
MFPPDGAQRAASSSFSVNSLPTGFSLYFLTLLRPFIASITSIFIPRRAQAESFTMKILDKTYKATAKITFFWK